MKRNQGMTIVEILISICIISIVVLLLFNMLIQVRNEDVTNQIQSNFVINQSTFIKEIEEDIINYGIKSISSCTLTQANISSELLNKGYEDKFKCIKFEYAADYIKDNTAFLLIYNTYARFDVENGDYKGREDSARWMVQYVRGHYKDYNGDNNPKYTSWHNATHLMKEYPSEVSLSDNTYVLYTAGADSTQNAASIIIPIANGEGEHYDINLSYIYQGNDNFKCKTSDEKMLECRCQDSPELCDITTHD